MSIPSRWVLVDDSSSEINYIGNSWFSQTGNPISTEDTGFPYQDTLHGTNTNATLTFNYTGSAITVKGTVQTSNATSPENPIWTCFVDGVQIGSYISRGPKLPTTSNSWIFCQNLRLTDGPHLLTLNATGTEKTFWFDRIEYIPSATVPLDNKSIYVSAPGDQAFSFSAGWGFGQTSQQGAHMTFDFIGTMLTWWTQYITNGNSTTATWSIDDGQAQNATLPSHNDGSQLYNQKVFDTGPLPMGRHRLSVTYNGNSSDTPLVLASMFIENRTFPTNTAGLSAPTGNTSSFESSRPSNTKLAPAVIGGIVGVVALLIIVIIVLGFAFYRHRRKSKELGMIDKFDIAPGLHAERKLGHEYGGDGSPSSSFSGTNLPHILLSQPMPRKVREDLGLSVGGSSTSMNGPITPQTVGLYQPMPRKAMENLAIVRGGLDHAVNREREATPSPNIGPAKGTSRVVVHQDSGVRLNNQSSEALDTPPEYD